MKDTLVFMVIMTVFMFMYSVSSYALMYPASPFEAKTIGEIVQGGLWILFGELNLEEAQSKDKYYREQLVSIPST